MKWVRLLAVGVFLLIFSVSFGDYLISVNSHEVTLSPSYSLTVTQGQVIVKPQAGQPPSLITPNYQQQAEVITNTNSKSETLIIVEDTPFLYIDFALILVSFGIIVVSLLGIFYNKLIRRG